VWSMSGGSTAPGDVGGIIEGLGVRCTSCLSDMAEWGRRRSVSSLYHSRMGGVSDCCACRRALDGAGGTVITVKGYLVKSWEAQVSY
jgi:hypothetical protein